MSRLLEPIALSRRKDDYLTSVDNEGWVTVDPKNDKHKYQIRGDHKVPHSVLVTQTSSNKRLQAPVIETEEMPVAHERENPDIIELLRKFTNRPTAESSGPSLRFMKRSTNEVVETFPKQYSMD